MPDRTDPRLPAGLLALTCALVALVVAGGRVIAVGDPFPGRGQGSKVHSAPSGAERVTAGSQAAQLLPDALPAAIQTSPAGASDLASPQSPAPSTGTAGPAPGSSPGGWAWPLVPVPAVLREFITGPEPWSPGHRGVDLAAVPGRPVRAASAGVVRFAGAVAGHHVLVLAHDGGILTSYEPVRSELPVGTSVPAGAVIGVLDGSWPTHCADRCLHWGARLDGRYLDPLTLLGLHPPAPVLLPLGG